MSGHGVELRLAASLLLLVLGGAAGAVLVADWGHADELAVPAAGVLIGGLYLAWRAAQGLMGRRQ